MHLLFKYISFSRIFIVSILFTCGPVPAFTQLSAPQPKFHNYTIDDGLPGSETYFVHQDKKGYIWICTDRGVARFDGYNFQIFTTENGLTDNVVFRIYEDYKGRLWFITYNSRLCYFENGRMQMYKYNNVIERESRVKISAQKNLHVGRNDKVYLSINYNDLLVIDKNGAVVRDEIEKTTVTDTSLIIKKFDNHLMWIFKCNNYSGRIIDSVNIFYSYGNKDHKIGRVGFDSRYNLASTANDHYILANDNLYSLTSRKKILKETGAIYVYGEKNTLWVGTFKNGVKHIPDINHPEIAYRYLENLSISSVLCDAEGGYWFTTLEKGVFYTPSLSVKNYTTEQGLLDDEVTGIAGIKNDIYLGFLLERWQNLNNSYRQKTEKEGNSYVVLGNSKHRFYISTFGSFRLVNGKLGRQVSTSWSSDYFSEEHSVLYGVRNVFRANDNGRIDTLYSFFNDKSPTKKNRFQNLMCDEHNILWIGSLGGLCLVENGNMTSEGLNDPLFKIRVSDLACHPAWKNVAATRGEGIYFFEHKKILRQIKEKDGLLSNLVNVIFIDETGGLWVGTSKGLNHIRKDKKGKIHIESFTTLHGLCSNEISSIYVYNGIAYVATKGGLSVIDTKSFKRNTNRSSIYVTSLETTEEKFDPRSHHVFNHRESYIKIGFRNTNYRTLQTGNYQYRFNRQSQWIVTQIPEISLINPLPGEYSLEIRYMNEDGVWSVPQMACNFTIDEAFYNKWYFITAVALLLGLITWWVFKYRIIQLKRRHILNNKINQLEQKALQAQMNPHFIFNALNSIQSFLVYEENEKAEKYLLKFAQLIRQTLNNSREPYIAIENEIEVLERYLDLERMRFRNKFRYKIHNQLSAGDMALKIPNMLIQPFVENAVIHGFSTLDSGGEINIFLQSIDGNQIRCIIEDNGIGRKKALQQSSKTHVSFGTTITEERLKAFETKHGIHFRIETIDIEGADLSTGTKVIINLPVI